MESCKQDYYGPAQCEGRGSELKNGQIYGELATLSNVICKAEELIDQMAKKLENITVYYPSVENTRDMPPEESLCSLADEIRGNRRKLARINENINNILEALQN